MKILITGGAGNVGSALANELAKKNDILVADNLVTGNINKLQLNKSSLKFRNIDVNDKKDLLQVFSEFSFDYVFHFAALVGVQRTINDPIRVLQDIRGIENICELSLKHRVKRIFYSSSSEVYGEPVEIPQREETTPLNAKLPYAVVKNIGECYFRAYQQKHNLNYTIFRFFNTYGPSQSEDFVIMKFIRLALKNQPITIYGDGRQTRTFCYIDDNVKTMIKCLEGELYINETLNIGSDSMINMVDLAKLIIRLTRSKSQIKYLPPLPAGDMTRRQPDVTRMNAILDWERVSLESGIVKTIEYIDRNI